MGDVGNVYYQSDSVCSLQTAAVYSIADDIFRPGVFKDYQHLAKTASLQENRKKSM